MKLSNYLLTYKRATITLEQIEQLYKGDCIEYQQFAEQVLSLEASNLLMEIVSKGRNQRTPSLAYQYRVNKIELRKPYHQDLHRYRQLLHSDINLDNYFSLDPQVFYDHLIYLQKIDSFLRKNSLQLELVPAPERSFQLVADEKWITDKGGKELLERVGLWETMKIMPVADPLMLAINPNMLATSKTHMHLIVENKTTWQALVPALRDTEFTSLILGYGEKIIKGIEQLDSQLGLYSEQGHSHKIYYFGDVDPSGIDIWYRLQRIRQINIAWPFYRACIEKACVKGKENQRLSGEALDMFLLQVPQTYSERIKQVIESRYYYPQEILTTNELRQIWKDVDLWSSP